MRKLVELEYVGKDAEQDIGSITSKILESLKSRGLYQSNYLLFRGFSSNRIRKTLKNGTDRDSNSRNWNHATDINPKNMLFAIPEYSSRQQNEIPSGVFFAVRRGLEQVKKGFIAKLTRSAGEFAVSVYERDLTRLETTWDPATYVRPDDVKPIAIFKIKRAREEGK